MGSVLITAPNTVLGAHPLRRLVWPLHSGVAEATDDSCTAIGWTMRPNLGSTTAYTLPALVTTVSAVHGTDWQGTFDLSSAARTNLVLYSDQVHNAAGWTVSGGASAAASAVLLPDGASTGSLCTSGGAASFLWQNFVAPSTGYYVVSCLVKAGTASIVYLKIRNQTTSTYIAAAEINPQTGLYEGGGIGQLAVQSLGGGWYRITAKTSVQATAGDTLRVLVLPGAAAGETTIISRVDCKATATKDRLVGPTTNAAVAETDYTLVGAALTTAKPMTTLTIDPTLVRHTHLYYEH